jgi:pyrimidine-nucleoside phosphorylase
LRGEGPPDFVELVAEASTQLLALSDLDLERDAARERVERAIADGSAVATYERWIAAQGGDPDEAALPAADVVLDVEAPTGGYVRALRPVQIGVAALNLGAGRRTKEDEIDYAVGVVCHKKRGDSVEAGEAIAEVHARDEDAAARAAGDVVAAYEFGAEPPAAQDVILGVLTQ